MTFTTTPTGKRQLEQEMKEFREAFIDAPLPTVAELCAPLAVFFDRISDYAYFTESLGWLYDFGLRDEVQPRIREIRDLLAGVVDQAGYIVRGCTMGDTLPQAVVLSSALRMVVEALVERLSYAMPSRRWTTARTTGRTPKRSWSRVR